MTSTLKVDAINFRNNSSVNLMEGMAKQWSSNTISSNTHTIQDSFNTSSLTDDGAGRTDIVFTNNMNSNRYAANATCAVNASQLFAHLGANTLTATNHFRVNTATSGGTITDYDVMVTSVHGDLA